MKHIRATARIDSDDAPAFFNLLAHNPDVDEARVLEVNTTIEGVETFLFAIDGDPSAFAAEATGTPGVESVEVSPVENGTAYALMVMRPMETPLFEAIHSAGPMSGFVLRTPMIYRDGSMIGRAVGDPAPLQRAMEQAPDDIEVQIEEIGEFTGGLDDPLTRLSERQREAVLAAIELGYYERPREATHQDVAAVLDCAPATASDHLQKAESKLVQAVMDEFGPSV